MLITNSKMGYYHPNLAFILLANISLLTYAHEFCANEGIFAENSTYDNNLKQVLSSLPSNISTTGSFYNLTMGEARDKIYSLGQCKGDLSMKKCFDCIDSASKAVQTKCPNQREAIIWGDGYECMMRYANRNIFGTLELEPSYELSNPNNISIDASVFNMTLFGLVGKLTEQASLGSSKKFAVGSTKNNSMYAMVQCTPDLSPDNCGVCLRSALVGVSNCCGSKEGGRFFRPSCFVWFEIFKFYDSSGTIYDSSPSPPLGQSPTSKQVNKSSPPYSNNNNNSPPWRVIVIVTVAVLMSFQAILCAIIMIYKRRSRKNVHDIVKSLESLQFDLDVIKEATNDFSDANKLGQGGFGSVYKGRLPNGQEIAVKRLDGHSMQGEEQFMNEVSLMAKLQHRNLVSLLGFCSEASEKILVYELLGSSLDHILFDPIRRSELTWETRYKFVCGIARGMLYLHEDSRYKVVHRDLKASNVLVDENMNPKISDFGMARLFQMDQNEANTRRHMGTYGYMAPEYALNGRFSMKSDVFSFGVLVLEIVSGKKNSWWDSSADIVHLLSYAWKNWMEGSAVKVIDSTLDEGSTSEIMRCVHIGLLCVQETAELRPTMASVVLMLTSHSATLPLPSHPAFYMYNNNNILATRSSDTQETESGQSTSTSTTNYLSIS